MFQTKMNNVASMLFMVDIVNMVDNEDRLHGVNMVADMDM